MAERKNSVRVYVVADSETARQELLGMLNAIPAVELVGVASDPLPFPPGLTQHEPDLLLLNLQAGKAAVAKAVNEVTQHLSRCKVIVLQRDRCCVETAVDPDRSHAVGGRIAAAFVNAEDQAQARIQAEVRRCSDAKRQPRLRSRLVTKAGDTPGFHESADRSSNRQDEAALSEAMRDIAERRREHAERRRDEIRRMEAAARFQSFVEQLPGMPYIANPDKDGSSIYVGPKVRELLGFTPEQWCGDPHLRLRQLHPDDRDKVLQAIGDAIDTASAYSIDYRIFDSGGALHWLHDEARIVTDATGKPLFLQGAALDITERKQAQEALERSHSELQELITALDMLRIEEQKRLAHEMHDDFGQLLAAMKMDLSTLRQHLPPDNSQIVQYLSSINELVDTMVTSVRRIIADLPPKTLEDLGLFSALESMSRKFERSHHIECKLQLPDAEPALDAKSSIAVYRMMQEAFNNVAKHAHATRIVAKIDCTDALITLHIADNGTGMSMDKMRKPGSFGLLGMRERAAFLGGEMQIESSASKGTAIRVVIPLHSTPSAR